MNIGNKEIELRRDFSELDEAAQDQVLHMARDMERAVGKSEPEPSRPLQYCCRSRTRNYALDAGGPD